jgi:hypothetical protein
MDSTETEGVQTMRITTIAGLAVAGAAAVAAVVVGGAAYAQGGDGPEPGAVVRIVTEEAPADAVRDDRGRDCPDKGDQAPGGGSPGSEAPADGNEL